MPKEQHPPRVGAHMPGRGRNLLSKPGPECIAVLEEALAALARAFPIPGGHRRELPSSIRELSRILTAERGALSRSYWSAPRLASAYLYFFLPWNLYRLAWLLPGLDLSLHPGSRILDLGSGPLTLPLALWCARPELRGMPLSFECVDVAVKPMEHGRAVFRSLAGDGSPWRFTLRRSPVEKALLQAAKAVRAKEQAGFDCIMAGNVLNELCESSAGDAPLARRLDDLTGLAFDALAEAGRFFLLEPGTRLGGKLITLARRGALERGFLPLAPCTHARACPMLDDMDGAPHTRKYSGWCHFIHPAEHASSELQELSARAHLEKDSLALSCLVLERGAPVGSASGPDRADSLDELEALYEEIMAEDGFGKHSLPVRDTVGQPAPGAGAEASPAPVRIISGPIRLPDRETPARYACSEHGLALLLDALHVPSGAAVQVPVPEKPRHDAKTGALLLSRDAPRQRPTPGRAPRQRPDRSAGKKKRP